MLCGSVVAPTAVERRVRAGPVVGGRPRRHRPLRHDRRGRHPAVDRSAAEYALDRRGTAATLRAIDAAHGGGFYDVPDGAVHDLDAAEAAFRGDASGRSTCRPISSTPRAGRSGRGRARGLPAAWPIPTGGPVRVDPHLIDGAAWAALVFGASETAVALLTSTPGPRRRQRAHERADRGRARCRRPLRGHGPGAHAHDRAPQPRPGRARRDGRLARDAAAVGVEVLHALGPADEGVADRRLVPRRRRGRLPVPRTRARARAARRRDAQGTRRADPRRIGRGRVAARHRSRPRPRSPTSRSSCTTRATSAIPTARKGRTTAADATAGVDRLVASLDATRASGPAATCTPSSAAPGS